ncbi:hypothetical protein YC2023_034894 [Brassica napus]
MTERKREWRFDETNDGGELEQSKESDQSYAFSCLSLWHDPLYLLGQHHPKMLYQITYIPSQINLTTNVSVLKQALNKTVREKSIQRNSKPANHHLSL